MVDFKRLLTDRSLDSYNDVEDVMDHICVKRLFDYMGYDETISRKYFMETFRNIYNIYNNIYSGKQDSFIFIDKIDKKFNPSNNQYTYIFDTIDGINNRESNIYNNFMKFNTESIYKYEFIIPRQSNEGRLKNIIINIKFLYDSSNSTNQDRIKKILQRLTMLMNYNKDENRLKFLSIAMQKIRDNTFDIYFLMYPNNRFVYPRKVSDGYNNLIKEVKNLRDTGCYNCSSGYTVQHILEDDNRKQIVVTRIPEMLGLLTHELGHLFGWDYEVYYINNGDKFSFTTSHNKETNIYNNAINRLCRGNMDISFYEAFNNCNSTIIHTMCNAIELGRIMKLDDFVNYFDLFKYMLKVEILYSIYHTTKILYWLGYNTFDDFFNLGSKNIYYQEAHLFEYTIIRSFLLLNLKEYITPIIKNDNVIKFKLEADRLYPKDGYIKPDSWHRLVDNCIRLLSSETDRDYDIKLRGRYKDVFDLFIKKVDNTKNRVNMEYFCIDHL